MELTIKVEPEVRFEMNGIVCFDLQNFVSVDLRLLIVTLIVFMAMYSYYSNLAQSFKCFLYL
jgi:hypothetical protein